MNNFTPEDLLEYFYKEMPPEKARAFACAVEESWSLKQKLSVIEEAASKLNKSYYSPREEAIQRILSYAAAEQVVSK